MYQAMQISQENVADREAAGPGLFGVAVGMLTLSPEKRVGFVHSREKWMVPVCKQTGYPEVERMWHMNRRGQRQQMAEEDGAGTEELPVPPQY